MMDEWLYFYEIASRGNGKTLRSATDVHEFARENENCHIAIAGHALPCVRNVMIEGPNGLLRTADSENPVVYYASKRRLIWPETGTDARIFTFDQADRLRGLRLNALWY